MNILDFAGHLVSVTTTGFCNLAWRQPKPIFKWYVNMLWIILVCGFVFVPIKLYLNFILFLLVMQYCCSFKYFPSFNNVENILSFQANQRRAIVCQFLLSIMYICISSPSFCYFEGLCVSVHCYPCLKPMKQVIHNWQLRSSSFSSYWSSNSYLETSDITKPRNDTKSTW